MTSKQAAAFIRGNGFGVVLAVVGGLGFADAAMVALAFFTIAYLFEWEADGE